MVVMKNQLLLTHVTPIIFVGPTTSLLNFILVQSIKYTFHLISSGEVVEFSAKETTFMKVIHVADDHASFMIERGSF